MKVKKQADVKDQKTTAAYQPWTLGVAMNVSVVWCLILHIWISNCKKANYTKKA